MSKSGKAYLNELYKKPLPVRNVLPLPPLVLNPVSILVYLYQYFWPTIEPSEKLRGILNEETCSVWIEDESTAADLWFSGFFGKGQFSRSEPSWYIRTQRSLGLIGKDEKLTAEEVTARRRVARAEMKAERARKEKEDLEATLRAEGRLPSLVPDVKDQIQSAQSLMSVATEQPIDCSTVAVPEGIPNLEKMQITLYEALFLSVALDTLDIYKPGCAEPLSNAELLKNCLELHRSGTSEDVRSTNEYSTFLVQYAVYHHYRSLGWTVKPGIKFGVDWLLYRRGPVFSHAEFSVIVVPNSRLTPTKNREWWWLHALTRVNGQVKKTLILTYVDFETVTVGFASNSLNDILRQFRIREVSLRRWLPSRNRD